MNKPFTLNPFLWAFRKAGGELVYNKLVAPFFRKPSSKIFVAGMLVSSLGIAASIVGINNVFGQVLDHIGKGDQAGIYQDVVNICEWSALWLASASLRCYTSNTIMTKWHNWARKAVANDLCNPKRRGIFFFLRENERESIMQRCTSDTFNVIMHTGRLSTDSCDKLIHLSIVSGVIATSSLGIALTLSGLAVAAVVMARLTAKKLQAIDTKLAEAGKDYSVSLLNTIKHKTAIEQWRGEEREEAILNTTRSKVDSANIEQSNLNTAISVASTVIFTVLRTVPFLLANNFALKGQEGVSKFGEVRSNADWFRDSSTWIFFLANPVNAWIATNQRLTNYFRTTEQPMPEDILPTYRANSDLGVTIRDLSITVMDKSPLCTDINLDLKAGDRIALTGPSGSGKSTFLRQLSGVSPIQEGSVTFEGIASSREVLFVPQNNYIPNLPFADIVAYPSSAADFKAEEIAAVIKDVGLEKVRNALENEASGRQIETMLSGGEKQRVNFARLLLNKPSVIGLDEATSALPHQDGLDLYKLLCQRLPNSIIISTVHRLELLDLHTSQGTIKDGKLTLSPLPTARNNAAPPKPQPLNIA